MNPLQKYELVQIVSLVGPASYATSFNATFPNMRSIRQASVEPSILEAADTVRRVYVSAISGNVVTIKIRQINTTTASPTAWADPTGVDFSGETFRVTAIGD